MIKELRQKKKKDILLDYFVDSLAGRVVLLY